MSNKNYVDFFATSLMDNLWQMAQLKCDISESQLQGQTFFSEGMAVILGITGKRPGRIIIDTSKTTAIKLSQLINGEEDLNEEEVMDTMAEFGNIISGHTVTHANNAIRGMNLMLTPPSIFCGEDISITSPNIQAEVVRAVTTVGNLVISIGFEGGM
ncbi:hypothetical protein JCM14036_27360 [Desulfotomaculum defluvii]